MGAHGNVGGGCYSDLLVDIPFKWIIGKAQLHGLNFRETVEIEPAACEAKIDDLFREFLFGIPYFVRLGIRYHRRIGARPKAVEENQDRIRDRRNVRCVGVRTLAMQRQLSISQLEEVGKDLRCQH